MIKANFFEKTTKIYQRHKTSESNYFVILIVLKVVFKKPLIAQFLFRRQPRLSFHHHGASLPFKYPV